MKHVNKSRSRATTITINHRAIFYALFMAITLMFAINAQASGSKMPDVAGTEIAADMDTGTGGSASVSEAYAHLDKENIVPKALLAKALSYYDANKSRLGNTELIGVIDFSQHSSKERFYIIDMSSGHVETYQTAHGKNSDQNNDGYAERFSNEDGSEMSSQGIYVTAETYYGSNGYSLRLDGKSSTNSNARKRAIVIHPADYVQPGRTGRSFGCPALDTRYAEELINRLKGGAVIYAK